MEDSSPPSVTAMVVMFGRREITGHRVSGVVEIIASVMRSAVAQEEFTPCYYGVDPCQSRDLIEATTAKLR